MVNTAPFGVIISFVSTFSNSIGMVLVLYSYLIFVAKSWLQQKR